MSKPVLTKLKSLSVLFEQPWYGNLLKNVVRPLALGKVETKNRSNIFSTLENETFNIRVDKMYESYPWSTQLSNEEFMKHLNEDVARTVTQINEAYTRFLSAGKDLYLKLTGESDIEKALTICNSFLMDGINVIAIRRVEGMVYKFPFNGRTIETSDPEELFLFLGSLANVFMNRQGVPDPNWFAHNADEGFPF